MKPWEVFIEVCEFLWLIVLGFMDYLKAFYDLIIPRPLKSLENEIILITGAGSGIGREVCIKLVEAGAKTLVLWDVNQIGNENTAIQLRILGAKAYPYQVDVVDRNKVNETAEKVKKDVGDVTILFNNAGITYISDFLEATPEQLEKTIQINLISHFWTLQSFLPSMIERGEGQVVTTCSTLGLKAVLKSVAYSASKFAVRGYIEALESEIRRHSKKPKITFTTIYPFFVNTPLINGLHVDYRLSFFFKNLETAEVAIAIVDGIRKNAHSVHCPKHTPWLIFLKNFGPKRCADRVMDFLIKNIYMNGNQDKDASQIKQSEAETKAYFQTGLKHVSKVGIY